VACSQEAESSSENACCEETAEKLKQLCDTEPGGWSRASESFFDLCFDSSIELE
jgi:hypothetical protein